MRCLSVILIFIFTLCHAGTYHPAIEYIFPLPESGLHSPQVTIFLRLHEELHHDIQNLNTFINITGDESVFHGQVIMSSDSRTIIFKPDQNFPLNNTVYVNILTTQIGYTDFNYYFTIASQNTNYLPAVEDFDSHAEIPISTSSAGQIRLINGVAVPSDFPQIEAHQYGETAPGYIFISSNFKSSGIGNYLIMCENDGTPYCYRHFNIPHNIANFVHQSTGVFSAYFFAPEYHVILDSTFAPIDLYRPGHGYAGDDHEFTILENGHALMTMEQHLTIDMSQVVNAGDSHAIVQGNMFQEFDADKNVIFEWRSWDHLNIEDASNSMLRESNIDYVHLNSIAIDYDGHYVISNRHMDEVMKINRETGEIIWRFGGVHNQFEFINDNLRFSYQHCVKPVPGHPNHYTMFDNGNN
ncbi:aryl-sulfate sulfotransferase [candidate division KSB1 bacterium]|nr:aryl-sulfate sulfotransferase [candidate division KSB1 bacterium]